MSITKDKMLDINQRVIDKAQNDPQFARLLIEKPWEAVKMCCDQPDEKYLTEDDLSTLTGGVLQHVLHSNDLPQVKQEFRDAMEENGSLLDSWNNNLMFPFQ